MAGIFQGKVTIGGKNLECSKAVHKNDTFKDLQGQSCFIKIRVTSIASLIGIAEVSNFIPQAVPLQPDGCKLSVLLTF